MKTSEKLRMLADHIRTVPNKNWNYNSLGKVVKSWFGLRKRECGCAVLHAATIFPELKKEYIHSNSAIVVRFRDKSGPNAVGEFLGTNAHMTEHIFMCPNLLIVDKSLATQTEIADRMDEVAVYCENENN